MLKLAKTMMLDAITYLVIGTLAAGGIGMLFGIRPYITMSGSMEPYIKTGSVCLVNSRASFYDVEEGDVIAFMTPSGSMVTHRAVGSEEGGLVLVTKGDNNDVEDGPTTTVENFRGKTLCSIPYIGYVLAVFKKPQYRVIVGIMMTAMVLLALIDLFVENEEGNEVL